MRELFGQQGHNPFNQNFWAEVRKFLRVEWIDVGSLLLALKLDGDFACDINDIV